MRLQHGEGRDPRYLRGHARLTPTLALTLILALAATLAPTLTLTPTLTLSLTLALTLELLREVLELLSEVATPAAAGAASDADGRTGDEWALVGESLGELAPCMLARRPRERPCHVACQAASADSLSNRRVSSGLWPVPQLEPSQQEPSPSVRSGGGAGEAALRTASA